MKNLFRLATLSFLVFISSCSSAGKNPSQGNQMNQDPYIWLEDVYSPKAAAWVAPQSKETFDTLSKDPQYKTLSSEIRKIALSKDRIPYPSIRNGHYINFWQDDHHVRGIIRQTTETEYAKKHPHWDTVLDIDALNKKEGKSWVFAGEQCLPPEYHRCLLQLSDGGKDKKILREFDFAARKFVEGGFTLPESKFDISWVDHDTVLVATDFGPGTLTKSGYPRQVKIWKRGTPLENAELIFSGKEDDVSSGGFTSFRPESKNIFIQNEIGFFEAQNYLYIPGQKLKKIPFPTTAIGLGDFQGMVLAKLRDPWKTSKATFTSGSVVSLPLSEIENPDFQSSLELVYAPDDRSTLDSVGMAKSFLYLGILKNVRSQPSIASYTKAGGWKISPVKLPSDGKIDNNFIDSFTDEVLVTYQNFATPPTLYKLDLSSSKSKILKTLPSQYAGKDVEIEQLESTSLDGTKIPYFLVHKKGMKLDGKNPTLLYAYGGFEISQTPSYLASPGKVWIEKGGVFALANIRGGGEFGPKWHIAALKENRQRAYEDFISVSEDLISRKITSPRHLGIKGGSNGGLLVGAVSVQRPDLYRAVICESALLDMIRYTKLPPGASWIAEYGDPEDPKMAAVISKYSPYQNIKKGVKYPKIFFYISTADDRVQPGHTRKMVARLKEYGNDVVFYENTEGGHGGAADIEQGIKKSALEYTYLHEELF
jgi:prolyl oligopeptidase